MLPAECDLAHAAMAVSMFDQLNTGRRRLQDSFKSKTSTGTSQPASRPSSASDKPAQQSSRPVHTPAAPAQAGKQLLSKASSKLTTTSSSSAVAAGTIALDGAAKPLAKAAQPGKAGAGDCVLLHTCNILSCLAQAHLPRGLCLAVNGHAWLYVMHVVLKLCHASVHQPAFCL